MRNGFKWVIIIFIALSGALAYLSVTDNLSYVNNLTGIDIPKINNLALLGSLLIVDLVMVLILFYMEYVKIKRKKIKPIAVPAPEVSMPLAKPSIKKGPVKVIEFEFNKKPKVPVEEYKLGNEHLKVRAELPKMKKPKPKTKTSESKKKPKAKSSKKKPKLKISKKKAKAKAKAKAPKKKPKAKAKAKAPKKKPKAKAPKKKPKAKAPKKKPKAKAQKKKTKKPAKRAKLKAKPKNKRIPKDKHDKLYKKTISQLEKIKKELK